MPYGESDEERDTIADECDEDAARILFVALDRAWKLASAARMLSSPRRGHQCEDISRSRAIRMRDCILAARMSNGERQCRGERNGGRRRDEWRIENDVVVRATRKDIIAERGNDVLLKEEEEYTSSKRRDFDEKNRRVARKIVRGEKDGGKTEETATEGV